MVRFLSLIAVAILAAGYAPGAAPRDLPAVDAVLGAQRAVALLEAGSGAPMPVGVRATHGRTGGFQDKFVMARLTMPDDRLAAALAWLGAVGGAAGPDPARLARLPGGAEVSWWPRQPVEVGEGALAGFAATRLGHAPEAGRPGRTVLWVFAFQV